MPETHVFSELNTTICTLSVLYDQGYDVEPIHDRVIRALRHVPGAVECHVFGSRARGTQDAWSDLDLQLVVDDVAVAEACVLPVLEAELDLWFAWRIPPEESCAWVVLPAGASPAHKSCADSRRSSRVIMDADGRRANTLHPVNPGASGVCCIEPNLIPVVGSKLEVTDSSERGAAEWNGYLIPIGVRFSFGPSQTRAGAARWSHELPSFPLR